jgi:hypothetical protein|nr:hypothetical protein [bacterium]
MPGEKVPEYIKKPEDFVIEKTRDDLNILNELVSINIALSTWETKVSPERKKIVESMIKK